MGSGICKQQIKTNMINKTNTNEYNDKLLCVTGYKGRTDNIIKGNYYDVLIKYGEYVVVLDEDKIPSVFLLSFFQ